MLPLLLLGALLFSPDQPVAPVTPGAAGVEVSRVHTAANNVRLAVVYGTHGRSEVSFVDADGALQHVASIEGMPLDLAATRDGFLLAYGPVETAEVRVLRIRNDGSLGITRSHGVIDYAPAMAGLRSRVLLFGNFPNELLVMDAEGRLIRRGIRVGEAELAENQAIAASSESLLLAWEEGEGIAARLVDPEGRFLSEVIPIAERGVRPHVASNGQDFLVTWTSAAGADGRIVSATGSAASPPFAIAHGLYVESAGAAWDGGEYEVAFTTIEALSRVSVSESGVAGEPVRVGATDRVQSNAELAWSPSIGTMIAWREQVICGRGSAVRASLNGEPPLLISTGAAVRSAPATAALAGNTFATAWLELRDALRVRARVGERIVELSSDRVADHAPAIAPAGGRVAVLWTEDACFGRRTAVILDAEGNVVKTLTIGTGSGSYNALATNGSEFVAVWTRASFSRVDIVAARFSLDGELLDAEPRVVATEPVPRFSSLAQIHLSAVWTGSEYLVIWERYPFNQIHMQRLSAMLDPIGAPASLVRGTEPHAAAGPNAMLITWRDGAEIRSLLVTHAGAVIAENAIAPGATSAVAAWGSEFLIIAGSSVVRAETPVTTLPSPERAAVAANGSRVHIAYEKDGEVYIREGSVPRARSVRHD